MTVELEQLNLKNGDVINQTHFKTIDNNMTKIEDTINGLPTVATSGSYNDLKDKPTSQILATVATSGKYSDLSGIPTILPITKANFDALTTKDDNTFYMILKEA